MFAYRAQSFWRQSRVLPRLSLVYGSAAPFTKPYIFHDSTRMISSSVVRLSDSPDLSSLTSIPSPPLAPVQEQILNALGEPTLSSLGLCSYWPSGWYQAALEGLHVSLELPWWAAIATTTLVIRLCLFPLLISQKRNLATYTDSMPKLATMQQRMTNARLSGNYLEMMELSKEMSEFMKTRSVNPLKSMYHVFFQVPVFLSVFAGIRGMASLPVESMRTGGLYWFTDLTIPDPYYLLPLISMTTTLIILETGAEMSTQHVSPLLKLFLRLSPCVGFLFVMNMPSGILWYWTISNLISLTQSFALRVPVIRNWLQLPAPPKPLKTAKSDRGFFEGLKESMTNINLLAELETRERLDAKKWQQAGRSAAPRTFAHDPRVPPPLRVTGTLTNSCSQPSNQRAQGSG